MFQDTIFVIYLNRMRLFGKLQHVVGHSDNTRSQSRLVKSWKMRCLYGPVVAIALQLSAPDAPEIKVDSSIVVFQKCRVYAVGTAYRVRLRDERPFGTIAYGDTETEYVVVILGAEAHIVSAVFFYHIIVPQLSAGPRNVVNVEYAPLVAAFVRLRIVKRETMIITHVKMVTVVIFGYAAFPVVRRIDIDPAIEDTG